MAITRYGNICTCIKKNQYQYNQFGKQTVHQHFDLLSVYICIDVRDNICIIGSLLWKASTIYSKTITYSNNPNYMGNIYAKTYICLSSSFYLIVRAKIIKA